MRALLGGWNAWLQADGETEPIDANSGGNNNNKNDKNDKPPAAALTNNQTGTQAQQIASPNPTIKEVDNGAATTAAQPAAARKATPTKPKRRPKRRTRGA
jgi:hypothetical protein